MAEKKKNTNAETRVERVNDAEERKKALAAALSYIEKEFGKGSIMRMGEGTQTEDVEVVSTGSLDSTWHWGWVVCRAAVSLRSTDRKVPARRR